MISISFKLVVVLAALSAAGLVLADTSNDDATLNQITGYRQWMRVNRDPLPVFGDLTT